MKRVLCIKYEFDEFFELTIDDWYDIVSEDDEFYYLFSDINFPRYYAKKNFLTESQYRKLKLEKINEKSIIC